jgi:type VI secretion system (T6SS) effector TldE1-like protein
LYLISAGIVALAIVLALDLVTTSDRTATRSAVERPGVSVIGKAYPQLPATPLSDDDASVLDDPPANQASFGERFSSSFGDRSRPSVRVRVVYGASQLPEPMLDPVPSTGALPLPRQDATRLPLPDPRRPEAARSAEAAMAAVPPGMAAAPFTPAPKSRVRTASLGDPSLPLGDTPTNRTAIYDITAKTVYMPDGERLEAHSGLGTLMDDPRYINVKNKGPTPPNTYELKMREQLFHGVRAIRMLPVDEDKMFGRDGILAHSYLLGPNGDSNGCISFTDYPKFLNAFLEGKVDRIVVVEKLANPPPDNKPGVGVGWLTERLKAFFKSS